MKRYIEGTQANVKEYYKPKRGKSKSLGFQMRSSVIRITARLACNKNYPVHFQLKLAENDQRHPQLYAQLSRDDDVAKSPAIMITFRYLVRP